MAANGKPRVLVSNDDGIDAPGLRSLVAQMVASQCFQVYVCAPSGERSAQSHAITLGRYLACVEWDVPGAAHAVGVDGTPADSVMLALNSPVLQTQDFQLVVSGINRGDNCGLHVIYSGTVGAAREAACKGIPSIAFSLDSHKARQQQDYDTAAAVAVALIKAALGQLPGADGCLQQLPGCVVNVNVPALPLGQLAGLHLTHQGSQCVFPAFKEVEEAPGPHMAEIDEHTPNQRIFRNYAGVVAEDDSEGSDMWAVKRRWVSVTPLSLRQDLFFRAEGLGAASPRHGARLAAVTRLVAAAAASVGLPAGGL